MKNKSSKGISALLLLMLILVLSCDREDEGIKSPGKRNESEYIKFSGVEVNSLISQKLGNVELNFQEKAEFLMDHIASKAFQTDSKINSLPGRTSTTYTHTKCVAGVYHQDTDEWEFTTSVQEKAIAHQVSIIRSLSSPREAGAYASIWEGTPTHMYTRLGFDIIDLIATNCGNSNISARAYASWIPSGGGIPFVQSKLDCTGPFVTAPNGGIYYEEHDSFVTWRSDLIPNASNVKIDLYYQNGTNLSYMKTLSLSTPNNGAYEHDDYPASMVGDGYIYKVKITPLEGNYPAYFSEFFFQVENL
jgi:hypothetical protein